MSCDASLAIETIGRGLSRPPWDNWDCNMVTLSLDEFRVALRLKGWELIDDVKIKAPSQRELKEGYEFVFGEFIRHAVFQSGFLSDKTDKYEQFAVTYRKPFSFSRYEPDEVVFSEYKTAAKRVTFASIQVRKTKQSFCRAATLEAELPAFFKAPDINALLDSLNFGEMKSTPKPQDFEVNAALKKVIKVSGMTRPEVARRSGVGLHALHNYLARPHDSKYRRCPEWVLDNVTRLLPE